MSWSFVDCPITSPIQLLNKSGVSEYWFSMQVQNANEMVTDFKVSADDGKTWLETVRQDYNFFNIASGTQTSTVDVKITSSSGKVVTVTNVKVASDARITGTSNF